MGSPPEATAMWVSKRSGLRDAVASSAAPASPYCDNHQSVVNVGGANSIWPELRAAMAAAGVIQRCSWISTSSTTTSKPSFAGARKNHVAKRLGAAGGGI